MKLTVQFAEVAILAGYFAMGVLMSTWMLPVKRWIVTVVAAIVFFASCALTHVHDLGHAVSGEPVTPADFSSWHMVLIHVPQAVAIWVAVVGFFYAQKYITRLHERIQDLEDIITDGGSHDQTAH